MNNATKGRGKIIEEKLLFKNKIFSLNYDEKEEQKLNDKEVENKIRNAKGVIHYYQAGTQSCGASRRPDDGTFWGRPWDVGHTYFLNST